MGLFVYTQKGSIISMVDLPTTEIIEPILATLDYLNAQPKKAGFCGIIRLEIQTGGVYATNLQY